MSKKSFTSDSRWNRLFSRVVAISGVAALCLGLTPSVSADAADRKTTITFSAPVEVPGKVLPAGTYVFKLLDSSSNRNIVEIFDKDEKKLYATLLAIPDYRPQPYDKTMVTFEERPSGSPEAIEAWFYPGDPYGMKFVYPHKRAVELAKRTNHNVLSMPDTQTATISTTATSASDAGIKEMQNTEVTGVNGSGDSIALTVIIVSKPQP
jgi:hypothetical protein